MNELIVNDLLNDMMQETYKLNVLLKKENNTNSLKKIKKSLKKIVMLEMMISKVSNINKNE